MNENIRRLMPLLQNNRRSNSISMERNGFDSQYISRASPNAHESHLSGAQLHNGHAS